MADTDHVSKPTFPLVPSGVDQRPAPSDEPARPDPLSGPRPSGGVGARSPWAFVHAAAAPPAAVGEPAVAEPAIALPALRTGPADAGTDWADDKRLDELFSAWAEAALSADVISERRFMGEEPEATRPDVTEPAPPPAPAPAPVEDRFEPEASSLSPLDAAEADPPVVAPVPSADPEDRWEPAQSWARGDDDIIPRARSRSRWRR